MLPDLTSRINQLPKTLYVNHNVFHTSLTTMGDNFPISDITLAKSKGNALEMFSEKLLCYFSGIIICADPFQVLLPIFLFF